MDDMAVLVDGKADAKERTRRKRLQRVLRVVRRVHMYFGLVLFPWVIFFGVTGMLFNHPGCGEATSGQRLTPADLKAAGVDAIAPGRVAEAISASLRAQGKSFRVDPSFESRFHGTTGFATTAPGQKVLTVVDLASGRGVVLTRPDRSPPEAPFGGNVPLADVQLATLEPKLATVLGKVGVADIAHEPRLAMAQVLRFRLVDDAGHVWNATYDLATGQLDGRRADRAPSLSLHDWLGTMHKTHHFPVRFGPTTLWVLFADLTALALIIWAITGIVMWVQIKKSRALGVVAISVALLLATIIAIWTDSELRFGNVRPSDPGDIRPGDR